MSFTRRSFLIGAGTGVSVLVLTACTDGSAPEPTPTPTPTREPTGLVPAPAAMRRSRWADDSFARGSVSYTAPGSTPEHRDALRVPLGDRVFFAGEATSSDHPGTVLGAQLTGAQAASDVADASDSSERVAVIGAGAAGAAAARALTIRGYDVVVIEARDRVGGRIDTVDSDDWPLPVELGAWRLFPGDDAGIIDTLQSLDVATIDLAGDDSGTDAAAAVYRSPDGEAADDPVSSTSLAAALAWAQQQSRDTSVAEALDGSGAADTAAAASSGEIEGADLLTQRLADLATVYGADADLLSGWYTVDVTEPPVLVTGGLSAVVVDGLDGIEQFLSTTVIGIAYNDDRVSLRLGTGESLAVDRVVVTVPLGVLQDDSIEFEPLLPFSHRTAIAALGMGTVDTVWLRFDEPFWTTDAVVWNLVGTDDDVTTWFNLEPITGEAVLVGIVGGEAALRTEELGDDDLTDALLTTLAPFAS